MQSAWEWPPTPSSSFLRLETKPLWKSVRCLPARTTSLKRSWHPTGIWKCLTWTAMGRWAIGMWSRRRAYSLWSDVTMAKGSTRLVRLPFRLNVQRFKRIFFPASDFKVTWQWVLNQASKHFNRHWFRKFVPQPWTHPMTVHQPSYHVYRTPQTENAHSRVIVLWVSRQKEMYFFALLCSHSKCDVCLFLLKRDGYCGYCGSHFMPCYLSTCLSAYGMF